MRWQVPQSSELNLSRVSGAIVGAAVSCCGWYGTWRQPAASLRRDGAAAPLISVVIDLRDEPEGFARAVEAG